MVHWVHRYVLAALLACGGCSFLVDTDTAGSQSDAGVGDGGPGTDGIPPASCDSGWPFERFSVSGRTIQESLNLSPGDQFVLDTTDGIITDGSNQVIGGLPLIAQTGFGGEVRLFYADIVMISAKASLRVEGDYPALVVTDTLLAVEGTIDASSNDGQSGAGTGQGIGCESGGGKMGEFDVASGGGGGAGFGGAGGQGGDGDAPGGAGGDPTVASAPIRAGCDGGRGAGPVGGAGGIGGGAIQLASCGLINVEGAILAGGGGGAGGGQSGVGSGLGQGGGGGGSGGYIGLDAMRIALGAGAILAANGGGGGGGSFDDGAGNDGADATPSALAASGGTTDQLTPSGGAGGAALVVNGLAGARDLNGRGGGGGGGGVGHIRIRTVGDPTKTTGSVISPRATVVPP